ncbi:hypothetical protein H0I31_00840 [Tenacibaculum sp. AHE15PA]|uniref:hypothetical protein n=1 Tax=unclassified Tenacibaculum TaxID=2635139 RepID=UPI001C4F6137|nr:MULTISPECIES: hypothetical protein [unclassified Tenacibaculum]QXP74693.1 hypothetical protein H0I30_06100 [Tenacibaculum sp. AHE14PA]QXP76204.1 hypothetical protein H0I31_00840 [Tenacibaculum sp. AHE15PA]
MSKFCVFCGEKPDKKTKEHIIPQWLIRLTGDPNRTISLGVNFNHIFETGDVDLNIRHFSFNSFQFPACSSCNNEYSELETNSSFVIKKILAGDYINNNEINTLLDWFDKVRIGLWLGSITLDKIKNDVNPKFYINNRIGQKDRALYVYKLSKASDGINFHGFNTPAFQFAPCVYGLRINNYFFINYSKDFLISENLGFPYFEYFDIDEDSRADVFNPKKGNNKITTPIINTNFIKPSFTFYQAIIDSENLPQDFINNYVKSNMSDEYSNRSSIYYYSSNVKKILKLDEDDEIIVDGKIFNLELTSFNKKITKNIIEELESIIKFNHHLKIENKEKASIIEDNRKHILNLHRAVKKVLYEFM